MSRFRPFLGWRYDVHDPGPLLAFPHELIDENLRCQIASSASRHVAHLCMSRAAADAGDLRSAMMRVSSHLDAWREEGLFTQEPQIARIVETTCHGASSRRGLLVSMLMDESLDDEVCFLEESSPAARKIAEAEIASIRGSLMPIRALCSDELGSFSQRLAAPPNTNASCVSLSDGTICRAWKTDCHEVLGTSPRSILILEGEDRYRAARAYQGKVRQAIQDSGRSVPEFGALECDFLMVLLIPDEQGEYRGKSPVFSLDLPAGLNGEQFIHRMSTWMDISELDSEQVLRQAVEAGDVPTLGMMANGRFWVLSLLDPSHMEQAAPMASEAWRSLDAAVMKMLVCEKGCGKPGWFPAPANDDNADCQMIYRSVSASHLWALGKESMRIPECCYRYEPEIPVGLILRLFW